MTYLHRRLGALLALLLFLGLAPACNRSEESDTPPVAAPDGEPVPIEVHADGYEPDKVAAEAGKPVTLVFTRTTDQGCGDVLSIPDYDIKKDLPLNQPVRVTITPKKAGPIAFTCGMGMFKGQIVAR